MKKWFILAAMAFGLLVGTAPMPALAASGSHAAVKTTKAHSAAKKGKKGGKKGAHKKHHKKGAKKHKKASKKSAKA